MECKYTILVPFYMQPLLGSAVEFADYTTEAKDGTRFRIEQAKNISFASLGSAYEAMLYCPHPDPVLEKTHTIYRKEVRVDAPWVPTALYNYIMRKYLEECRGVRHQIISVAEKVNCTPRATPVITTPSFMPLFCERALAYASLTTDCISS